MKSILCFGDSNTWGYNPEKGGERHNYEDRWTTILQKKLGDNFLIVPEGQNGRTSVWDDPTKNCVNGKKYILPCLESHKPLDLVVVMLGTNDLKQKFNLPAVDIASGVGYLCDIITKSGCGLGGNSPEILVLVPPEIRKLSNFKDVYGNQKKVSKQLPKAFSKMCSDRNINCFNLGEFIRFSDADGIHYSVDQLTILANLVTIEVQKVLKL